MPNLDFSKPKTFYFGMDDYSLKAKDSNDYLYYQKINGETQENLLTTDINNFTTDSNKLEKENYNGLDDIALKLRPTLPKKPPEIPRFSPSAAWKLLSALETSDPMSTASDEMPVHICDAPRKKVIMLEEEIERLSCPVPFLMALQDPRSSHDKSGDSGISGDAGAVNDDSFDLTRSPNRIKPTWTPEQDLDEESSTSEAVELNSLSPYPPMNPAKFPTKPHVFSLSLPREENRSLYSNNTAAPTATAGPKTKQDIFFYDSLQKLKRSVSGALGFTPIWEFEKKLSPVESNTLDDNWLLTSSAPNSLQHHCIDKSEQCSPWRSKLINIGDRVENEKKEEEECYDNKNIIEERSVSEFTKPSISAPPFLSHPVSRGHIMYLPDSNLDLQFKKEHQYKIINYKKPEQKENIDTSFSKNENRKSFNCLKTRKAKYIADDSCMPSPLNSSRQFSKSCENISYQMKNQATESSKRNQENFQDALERKKELTRINQNSYIGDTIKEINNKIIFNLNKPRKFTFQSTVRQIERRRLAEKLSKDAEAKERQRKNELEAMKRVEEEFQKKRSKEKANIRYQLRLYNMDINKSCLSTLEDTLHPIRAEPDGAPSSTASSPTYTFEAKNLNLELKNNTPKSGKSYCIKKSYHNPGQKTREYKHYDWTPLNTPDTTTLSSLSNCKQTTVHPKVIYDIPKSSPIVLKAKATNPNK